MMNVRNHLENLSQISSSEPAPSTPAVQRIGNTAMENSPAAGASATDVAQVSSAAVQLAQSAAVPDVRLDTVANIQGALQSGTYSVSADAVAKKVLDAMLATEQH